MKRTKTRPALIMALVAMLSPTSISAATIGDGPLSNLEFGESPPTFGGCEQPLSTMSGPYLGREGVDFRVTNRTSTATTDFVILDVVADGRKRQFWVTIDLPPRSELSYAVRYLTTVATSAVRHCRQRPGGIVEGSDPILTVVEAPPIEW